MASTTRKRRAICSLLLLLCFVLGGVFCEADQQSDGGEKSPAAKPPSGAVILGTYADYRSVKKPNAERQLAKAKKNMLRQLSAKSAIIIDARSGTTIFAKDPDTPRQPASTIKILTGIIALDALKAGETVAVSARASAQPSSKVYLDQRKEYQAGDLIDAVLLASANDASVALAEKIAGSEKTFAEIMTMKAKLLGAKSTVCKTATGLTAEGQSSTARDLAIIFNKAMARVDFAERMKRRKVKTASGLELRNHNRALWQVRGTEGGKTGFTNAARQTYVGKFKRGDDEIVIAVMGSEQMWLDVKRLVEYGFQSKQLIVHRQQEKVRLADG